jgi:hypothetical protein
LTLRDHHNLLHCCIGMATEAGELLDVYKKIVYYNRGIDSKIIEMYLEESGDLRFYMNCALALLADDDHAFESYIQTTAGSYLGHIGKNIDALDPYFNTTEAEVLKYNMWKLRDAPNARYKAGYSDVAAELRADKVNGENILPDMNTKN